MISPKELNEKARYLAETFAKVILAYQCDIDIISACMQETLFTGIIYRYNLQISRMKHLRLPCIAKVTLQTAIR